MAFTVQEYSDLIRLLTEHPEWRLELRRLLVPEDYLELPTVVRDLAEAQERTEQALARLAEAQRHTEEGVGRLEAAVERLAGAVETLVEQVRELTRSQEWIMNRLGGLRGRMLELDYERKAAAYFGPLLRRLRVVSLHTLEDELEAHLSPEEFEDVFQLDLLVSGQPRYHPEKPEVWLAVEVSAVVDKQDVTRARRRAALLTRAGYRAIPVVAGEQATMGAEKRAREHNVVLFQDGRAQFWEEALEAVSAG